MDMPHHINVYHVLFLVTFKALLGSIAFTREIDVLSPITFVMFSMDSCELTHLFSNLTTIKE